jgi:hypothetical protein
MAKVDEEHEVFGGAEPAGGGEIPRDLIPPRIVKGMLHHRHKLYVCKAHLLDIGDKAVRDLGVGEHTPLFPALPRPEVELVDVDGLAVRRFAHGHPALVAPHIIRKIVDL